MIKRSRLLLFSLFFMQPMLGMEEPPKKDLVCRSEDLAASSNDFRRDASQLGEQMEREEKEGLLGEWKRGWADLKRVFTGNKSSSKPTSNPHVPASNQPASLQSFIDRSEAIKTRLAELSNLPRQTFQTLDERDALCVELSQLTSETAKLLAKAQEQVSPLLPPSSRNSRATQLARSHDEQTFADQKLQEKKRIGDNALLKARRAQNRSMLWGFACLSGLWFSTYSWNTHWCDEKISIGVGVASGACGLNAMRWYLKYRKQDRTLEKLTEELLK